LCEMGVPLASGADSGRMTGYSEAIQLDDKSDNRKLTCYVNLSHYAIVKHPMGFPATASKAFLVEFSAHGAA